MDGPKHRAVSAPRLHRQFRHNRAARQWMAAAYERLLPILSCPMIRDDKKSCSSPLGHARGA